MDDTDDVGDTGLLQPPCQELLSHQLVEGLDEDVSYRSSPSCRSAVTSGPSGVSHRDRYRSLCLRLVAK